MMGSKSSLGWCLNYLIQWEAQHGWKWWWIGANCDGNLVIIRLSVNKVIQTVNNTSAFHFILVLNLFFYILSCVVTTSINPTLHWVPLLMFWCIWSHQELSEKPKMLAQFILSGSGPDHLQVNFRCLPGPLQFNLYLRFRRSGPE